MTTANTDTSSAHRGFDSPVASRQDDHLNRWPLAREVFGIATTGPKAWSVRVGIYGEWGTGKTSVLRFVDSMASQAGHIVIWFDPWEHSTKHDLWQAFVLTVFEHLERKLGQVPGADQAKRKAWMDKAKGIVGAIAGIANDKAGEALDIGLNLVRRHFDFSPEDLASLQSVLGDRRVIILIDDLDRTAPQLVPEILFALKELMDIPAFSFICAFDPLVVGQVLGDYHRGFGDGLKFLDKIIDYPRWLPPPAVEGLANLSVAEAAQSCNYVPQAAIRDAVSLLPKNPRAVRQFIRLLTLLKPHIERHYDYELNWPVILTANILKIRHPRLAHELLNAPTFWSSIGVISLTARSQDEGKTLDTAVSEHIDKTCANLGFPPGQSDESERKGLKNLLKAICSHVALFSGLDEQGLAYQVNVAEAPAAVTWKEFDSFLTEWKSNQANNTAKNWITSHAQRVERAESDVYRELLNAAINRYAQALHKADNVFAEAEKPAFVAETNSLLALLNALIFDLGQLNQPAKQIGEAELALLVDVWARFAAASLPVHTNFWPRNEALILDLFEKWSPDITPLMRLLSPYVGTHLRNFEGKAAVDLHKKLCTVALPKFARQLIASFREPGFVERLKDKEEGTFDARCMIWDAKGPLWGPLRNELFQILGEAGSNRYVQANAYELLHWFALTHEGHVHGDPKAMQALLSDQTVFEKIWEAATATPLASRAVYRLRGLQRILKQLGVNLSPPTWWQEIMSTLMTPASSNAPIGGSESGESSEEAP